MLGPSWAPPCPHLVAVGRAAILPKPQQLAVVWHHAPRHARPCPAVSVHHGVGGVRAPGAQRGVSVKHLQLPVLGGAPPLLHGRGRCSRPAAPAAQHGAYKCACTGSRPGAGEAGGFAAWQPAAPSQRAVRHSRAPPASPQCGPPASPTPTHHVGGEHPPAPLPLHERGVHQGAVHQHPVQRPVQREARGAVQAQRPAPVPLWHHVNLRGQVRRAGRGAVDLGQRCTGSVLNPLRVGGVVWPGLGGPSHMPKDQPLRQWQHLAGRPTRTTGGPLPPRPSTGTQRGTTGARARPARCPGSSTWRRRRCSPPRQCHLH